MEPTDESQTCEQLRAQVAHLSARLADVEAHHLAVRDDLLVRAETLESHRHSLELLVDAYADLYDFAPIAYLSLDAAGLIQDINLAATNLLEVERSRVIGRPLRLHVAPADRRAFLDHMLQCRRATGQVVHELHLRTTTRRDVPVQLLTRRATATADGGLSFRTVLVDLSERQRAEDDQRRSNQRLSLALTASETGLFESTWPGGHLVVNERWAAILGYELPLLPPDRELARWRRHQIDPAHLPACDAALRDFLGGHTATYTAEFRVRHASGRWLWVRELAQAADRDPRGQILRVVGVMVDITLEKTRLAEARERTAQLQSLSAALFKVEENERRELATLLHDDLGQRLVAVRLRLARLEPAAVAPALEILDQAHATVRSLAFQLSPPILRDLGLVSGLRWLAREFNTLYDLPVEIDGDDPLPRMVGDPVFLLFRCVRELLLNTVKHARASLAHVTVTAAPDEASVHILVEDDGVGFDPAATTTPSRSFGLLSVRERLAWLGGQIVVDSAVNRGTRVRMVVPCDLAAVAVDP